MAIAIKMPKLSPTMETGVLSGWLVKVGDIVKEGSIIGEIETDKAIMEVEALGGGEIACLFPIENQELPVNTIIGFILEKGEKAPESWEAYAQSLGGGENKSEVKSKVEQKIEEKTVDTSTKIDIQNISHNSVNNENFRIYASPLAKKIASLENIDLSKIKGTGPNGRIIKVDLENSKNSNCKIDISNAFSANSKCSSVAPSYEIPMTGMRKVIAERLTKAKQEMPHIYLQKKIYMDSLEEVKNSILEKFGKKISMTPFFIKASAMALKENPVINRSFENGKIMQHNGYNVNIAIAVEGGLVVPVIKNADMKNLLEISDELMNLGMLAKEGKLRMEHSQGGTFSISNLGMFGVDSFQAIINPPQVAIIAIAATSVEAFFDGEKFIPRKVMKCELSCDHRIVDGADAARFLQSFAKYIENPEGMLL